MNRAVTTIIAVAIMFSCSGISGAGEGESVKPLTLEDLIRLRNEKKEEKDREKKETPAKPHEEKKPESKPPASTVNETEVNREPESSGSRASAPDYSPRSISGSSQLIYPVGKDLGSFKPPVRLPNDGSVVISRMATIAWEKIEEPVEEEADLVKGTGEKWLVATFENRRRQIRLSPRRLLKCALLETVEKTIREKPDTRFVITGVSTVFNKKSYLLIRSLSILEEDLIGKELTSVAPAVPEKGEAEPDKITPTARKGRGQEADEFISDMLFDRPGKTVLKGEAPKRDPEARKPFPLRIKGKPLQDKSSLVASRIIRVTMDKENNWYIAKFIGDNTVRESPLRIHPSVMLHRIVRHNKQIGRHTYTHNYQVSGDITSYRGHKYLLITKMFRQRHLGRF